MLPGEENGSWFGAPVAVWWLEPDTPASTEPNARYEITSHDPNDAAKTPQLPHTLTAHLGERLGEAWGIGNFTTKLVLFPPEGQQADEAIRAAVGEWRAGLALVA